MLDLVDIIHRLSILFTTDTVHSYLWFPTCSVSPFLQFFLLGRCILRQLKLIFLHVDFSFKVTWHLMLCLYLGKPNKKQHPSILIVIKTDNYLSAPSGFVLYITDSPAPILNVFFVSCLLAGQLKSIKLGKEWINCKFDNAISNDKRIILYTSLKTSWKRPLFASKNTI